MALYFAVRHGEVCLILALIYHARSKRSLHDIGPKYKADEIFDLEAMQPYSLKHLYTELKRFSEYVVLYLPRTSDLRQISELVEEGQKAQVVHYCTQGASRALCVYLGPFKEISS